MKTPKLLPIVFAVLAIDIAIAQAQDVNLPRDKVAQIIKARLGGYAPPQSLDSYIRYDTRESKLIARASISESNG